MASDSIAPIVTLQNGQPVTNSRDVAEMFGKRHDHILRDIDILLAEAPSCAPNFGEALIDHQMPRGGSRRSRAFNITRDGFTLLAMGFTGTKALQFKIAYINRFNEMGNALRTHARSRLATACSQQSRSGERKGYGSSHPHL